MPSNLEMLAALTPGYKLTRESNFGHLTGEDRVEVMRGSLAEATAQQAELASKFVDLRVEKV